MPMEDFLFYGLDLVIIGMLIKMLLVSKKVELEIDPGLRWLIPVLFLTIALFSFIRFSGIFRYIQTILLSMMAVMYWFMKSGLTPTSIVMVGREIPYDKAGSIFIDESDHSLHFKFKGSSAIYFRESQTEEIKAYLEASHVKLAKKKKDGTTIQRVDPTASKKKF
ncbi:MAG: hypothetical protein EOM64_01045 [Erysipelotrichia bacterium]|nr:hypothetical protein [Erysipelotrichia bacterium]